MNDLKNSRSEQFNLSKKAVRKAKENYPEAFEDNPKESNLSEKEFVGFDNKPKYNRKDVKEFIKRLNEFSDNRRGVLKENKKGKTKEMIEWIEGCRDGYRQLISELNNLAGDKLNGRI